MASPKTSEEIRAALEAAMEQRMVALSTRTIFRSILNAAPKGPHHGKHRRPNPQTHSDSANGAGGADDGADPIITSFRGVPIRTIRTLLPTTVWRTINSGGSGPLAVNQGAGLNQQDLQLAMHQLMADVRRLMEVEAPIPYAGVLAGEITGYRVWFYTEGKLCSLAHYHLWEPKATESGDINAIVDQSYRQNIKGGVYAFHAAEQVRDELDANYPENACNYPVDISFDSSYDRHIIDAVVWGTVKLWGEVVEHEKGYRAQFAKVTSLDGAWGHIDLPAVRKLYGV